jgi:hypothetical protein
MSGSTSACPSSWRGAFAGLAGVLWAYNGFVSPVEVSSSSVDAADIAMGGPGRCGRRSAPAIVFLKNFVSVYSAGCSSPGSVCVILFAPDLSTLRDKTTAKINGMQNEQGR